MVATRANSRSPLRRTRRSYPASRSLTSTPPPVALLIAFDGQIHQPRHQFRQGDAACLPQLWIHADGGEARDGVDLVEQHALRRAFEEEIDARHASAVEHAEGAHGDRAHFL